MLVITKMLTNVTFKGHTQHVWRQTHLKINHTCKWMNTCNIINTHQNNDTVENGDSVKSYQINQHPKKSMNTTIC